MSGICKTRSRPCHGLGLHYSHGVEVFVKIDGIMNTDKHCHILSHHTMQCGTRFIGNNFVFHHGNDAKH